KMLEEFYRDSPVLESDCTMNKICHRIQSVDFGIKHLLKQDDDQTHHEIFIDKSQPFDEERYKRVVKLFKEYKHTANQILSNTDKSDKLTYNRETKNQINMQGDLFRSKIVEVCSNESEAIMYLVHLFYVDSPKSNKDILWTLYGEEMVENLKNKKEYINVPVEDENGEIAYLNKYYTVKEVRI
ncbi:MAG: hypothetical protein WD512_00675, partial [Candidatus Paceibacterota bacterium]